MQSSVCFDSNEEINSEVVHQVLMTVFNDRPHDEIVKQHLAQSQSLHAQVLGLRRVHDVYSLKTEQLMTAIEQHASGVFIPPCPLQSRTESFIITWISKIRFGHY
ncbi:hypothetical protein AFI02nite_36910 [Aliivibrio fischeri]|uniref:Uncharacterized protein n=1 Tax=Aliivibrio fischeri TaxID=668 RepID=A0A510US12_ALIFS|nr:hypothetical protein AFI02nite_36910 [Aliivibrio fischeri]